MKNLLFKELKLCLTPQAIIFACLSVLIVIPSWPSLIAFIYTFMAFFAIFPVAIANRDMEFTVILPVRKRDIVKGKAALAMSIELFSILLSIPFALIKVLLINPHMTASAYSELGINLVMYGIVFFFCGIFNLMFLTLYYKNPYKTAKSQIISSLVVVFAMMMVMALFMFFPDVCTFVNTFTGIALIVQFIALGGGILVFICGTWLACRLGGKLFEKVDL